MKWHYDREGATLAVELAAGSGVTAREIAPGIRVDFDGEGRVVGLQMALQDGGVDRAQLETLALLSLED